MVCLTVAETFDVVLGEAAVGLILEGRGGGGVGCRSEGANRRGPPAREISN
jgi:hypothetical protein